MTKFEFLMMIAAVVVAVGMTEIVGGWGRLLRTSADVKFDWLHLGFSVALLLNMVQYWLGMWPYYNSTMAYGGQIYFLVVPSLFFVLAAYALSPDVPQQGVLNLRDYYMQRRRAIFIPWAASALLAIGADVVIVGPELALAADGALFAAFSFVIILLPSLTHRIWVHTFSLVLLLVSAIAFTFASTAEMDARFMP